MAMHEGTAGATLPIEIRWSTAQNVRFALQQHLLLLPFLAVPLVLSAREASSPPYQWLVLLYLGLWILLVVLDIRRRGKQVLRVTEVGLYVGRDDGKRSGWIAGSPIQIPWSVVRGVRIIERRWSRSVIVDTTGLSRLLPFPTSTSHPGPELDRAVDLIRRTWDAWRGPLPPPEAPPWFLPIDPPAEASSVS